MMKTRTTRVVFASLALLFAALPLCAQEALLLKPDLESSRVTFRKLLADGVEVADQQGEVQKLAFDQVLRLTFLSSKQLPDATHNHAIATLVDGQVLVGQMLGPGEDGESLRLALLWM